VKHLILGIIGAVWGSAILINGIIKISRMDAGTAYGLGQWVGSLLGLLLIIAGISSIIKWKNNKQTANK
jgi:predicted transporter